MRARREEGFTLLELMSVVLVIGILLAIAVPGYVNASERAQYAVLDANSITLADKVAEFVLDGRSVEYKKSGRGGDEYVSTALEEDLKASSRRGPGDNDQSFRNPVSGSALVVNRRSINLRYSQPAVFITDGAAYRYDRIRANPKRLAGTLIVCFDGGADTIEVFYMDQDGRKSDLLIRRAVSDAAH